MLTVQSSVFKAAMSNDGLIEAQTNVIKIKDASAEPVESLVEFLHLGTIRLEYMNEELFELADRYDVKDLKVCQFWIRV